MRGIAEFRLPIADLITAHFYATVLISLSPSLLVCLLEGEDRHLKGHECPAGVAVRHRGPKIEGFGIDLDGQGAEAAFGVGWRGG